MSSTNKYETKIKAMVLNRLRSRGEIDSSSTIINEFNVDNSSRRVDLAIITRNKTVAIEIKSEADSLSRLESQTEKYLHFFDKLIVVVATKHLDRTLTITPTSVEVWEKTENKLIIRKRGKISRITNNKNILKLLVVTDLKKLLSGYSQGAYSLNRNHLEKELLSLPNKTIRRAAQQSIQKRFALSSTAFWNTVNNREILADDISALSRFHKKRVNDKKTEQVRIRYWENGKKLEPEKSKNGSHLQKVI